MSIPEVTTSSRIAIAIFVCGFSFTTVAKAHSQNGQINGFRYQSCEAANCIVVEAPRAWLSVANGAFVAESGTTLPVAEPAVFRLLKNRKIVREFKASEIVHRPEIGMMTIETPTEVVLFDHATYELEAVRK